jgi:hypothetical protein
MGRDRLEIDRYTPNPGQLTRRNAAYRVAESAPAKRCPTCGHCAAPTLYEHLCSRCECWFPADSRFFTRMCKGKYLHSWCRMCNSDVAAERRAALAEMVVEDGQSARRLASVMQPADSRP